MVNFLSLIMVVPIIVVSRIYTYRSPILYLLIIKLTMLLADIPAHIVRLS